MNYNLPGCSPHGILQARILEWVAISFSRGSSLLGDRTQASCIAGRFFTNWATREAQSERSNISKRDIFADKENIWDQRDHSNVLQTITFWVRCTSDPSEEKTSLYLFFWKTNGHIHLSLRLNWAKWGWFFRTTQTPVTRYSCLTRDSLRSPYWWETSLERRHVPINLYCLFRARTILDWLQQTEIGSYRAAARSNSTVSGTPSTLLLLHQCSVSHGKKHRSVCLD